MTSQISKSDSDDDGCDLEESEDPQESGPSSAKKRRKSGSVSSDDDDRLEDDDYDLLEENLGIRFKKKFKRVKVIDDDDSDEEVGVHSRKNKIAEDLFDLDDETGAHSSIQRESVHERASSNKSYSSEESSEDEIDDFIVDDAGVPIRRSRVGEVSVTDERLQVAQDIFGVDFEVDDFDLEEDIESDEEPRVKSKKSVKLRDIYEPSVLESLHFTEYDSKLQALDVPERIQRRNIPVFSKEELLIGEETTWMFEELQKMQKQLGKAYYNDDAEDWSLNFDEPNERTTLGRKEERICEFKQTLRTEAVSAPLPVDDSWENETVVSQKSTRSAMAMPPPIPAPATDDDDEWGTSSVVSEKSTKSAITMPTSVPAAAVDDDDEWGTSSAVSQSIISRPPSSQVASAVAPTAPSNVGFEEDDEWEKGSVTHGVTLDDNIPVPNGSVFGSEASHIRTDPKSEKNQAIIEKIRKVLDLIKYEYCEVPYIAMYQKDIYMPELTLTDLWNIQRLYLKYCQLQKSKRALNLLLSNIDEFLSDENNKDIITSQLGEDFRQIGEQDYGAVSAIRNIEEVNDFRTFYTLYYSSLADALKAYRTKMYPEKETSKDNVPWDSENDLVSTEPRQKDGEQEGTLSESKVKKTLRRRPLRSGYDTFKNLLQGFFPHYGMSPAEFADNVKDEYVKNNPKPATKDVLEVAEPFTSTRLATREMVVQAANLVMATEISREPEVRRNLRNRLFENGALSVTPTEAGKKIIDESHPLYTMKYLRNKPIEKFERDEFIKLTMGEQDKLVEITLSDEYLSKLKTDMVEEWSGWFNEDGFSGIVQGWNLVKKQCLEQAVFEFMLPTLVKELKMRLEKDSNDFVVRACRRKVRKLISMGKFKFSFDPENGKETEVPEEWSTKEGIRVMAMAYDSDPAFVPYACVLDKDGSTVNDFIALKDILLFRRPNEQDLVLQEKTLKKLQDFIKNSKPHVIVIGGESVEADTLEHLVKEVVLRLHIPNEDNDDEDDEFESFPLISVELMDNDAAKVFSYSKRGMAEFLDHPVVLRQAISLARRMADSWIEIGQLFNSEEDILCLKLHPFQSKISKEDLLDVIEEEFAKITNQIGLDFNECLADPRKGHMLQFICGLGPTKAAIILRTFKKKLSKLKNREQLQVTGNVGPIVYRNCAAFIRINTLEMDPDSDETFIEYLDCTRIHPESYKYARVMAHQAFEDEDENDTSGSDPDANQEERVKKALDDPELAKDLLKQFQLELYADHLMSEYGLHNQLRNLESIRDEYYEIFRDPRKVYESPSAEEVFSFLTKETAQTLYNGKFLIATVTGFKKGCLYPDKDPIKIADDNFQCPVCKKEGFATGDQVFEHFDSPRLVYLRLDNGLKGTIAADKLSDQKNVILDKRVSKAQPVQCRVTSIHIGKRQVDLTSAGSDLRDEENKFRPPKDPFYDEALDFEHQSKLKKAQTNKGCIYKRRPILHTSFQNISYNDCAARLDCMEIGDAVFRPSSKGTNYVTLSWKMMDGVMQHVLITEQNKPDELSLGRTLVIDGEEYDDLDEILTRYVYRVASAVRELLNHKNFMDTKGQFEREKAEEILRGKLEENRNQLHYVFSPFKKQPGRFYLSYSLSTSSSRMRCAHEIITVTPDGFRYRGNTYDSLCQLLRHFKNHYRDPPPTGTPLIGGSGASTTTGSSLSVSG